MKASVYIGTFVAAALGVQAGVVAPTQPSIRNVYTFPKNTFIENIAVRSNSKLLITSMSVPDLFLIDPTVANATAPIVHTFANATGISGIAEISPDVFALVTGVWDLINTRAQLGSLAVWTVDFNRRTTPLVRFVTQIQNSTIFNGIVRHPTNPRILLAADSALGAVWRVDLVSGAYGVAFVSPLLAPTETAHLGINGLKAAGSHLYFTNSAQKYFGKVGIDANGNQVGAIEVISNATAAGADVVYDDIALNLNKKRKNGQAAPEAWIASHPDYAIGVSLVDGSQRVIADAVKLLNPTSAAFGRGSFKEEKTLYVTNGGEFTPEWDLINEGVVAIDLR
ncbi:hypothetical protein B0H63DRAFT_456664 [Podospora didyma]|uniref:SMP-30/Gluconolactonase/LRE-like region domain-containing protein n=1 Tax=Podospora didyma TaxID=330526 RepID=A0AAE0P416_9PEZI|nr:hypothetical protein B0H63DRAFT_456664 [Podospora didyma]